RWSGWGAEAAERVGARPVVGCDRHPAHRTGGAAGRAARMTIWFDIGLAALLLAIAAWTMAARDAFPAVLPFIVYGLLVSLAWVVLVSGDGALTEAAIGGGVTGMLLLGAASRLSPTAASARAAGMPLRIAAAVLSALITAGLAIVVLLPSEPAPTLAPIA